MLPCFKCKKCNTNWIIDIYSDSKEGIIQEFISHMRCPICGKRNLRVCFIQKVDDRTLDNMRGTLINYDEITQSLI